MSDAATSSHVRRLASRVERTTARFMDEAARGGQSVADLPSMRLPWYEVRDEAGGPGGDPATVLIYDEIGGSFGVTAKDFAVALEKITAPTIHLRINSPGGSLFDAIAIYNTLHHHPARVVVYVDALAASAASLIAMGGDEIVMMPGSQLMIHDASAVEDGNAADMRAMSAFLDRQSDNVADIYRLRGGGEAGEWRELMLAETWMFAAEAVDMGLADRVEIVAPAPAPEASISGTTPRMKAKAVIRIGRKRRRADSSAASSIPMPPSCLAFANSTIKIAFLAASPISMMLPIWT